jgi:hypothetical protein
MKRRSRFARESGASNRRSLCRACPSKETLASQNRDVSLERPKIKICSRSFQFRHGLVEQSASGLCAPNTGIPARAKNSGRAENAIKSVGSRAYPKIDFMVAPLYEFWDMHG